MHERSLRSTIVKAREQFENALAKGIHDAIDEERLAGWRKALVTPRESGVTLQSWLWAPPAKHSTRQIEELLARPQSERGSKSRCELSRAPIWPRLTFSAKSSDLMTRRSTRP